VFIKQTESPGALRPYTFGDLVREALEPYLATIEKDAAGLARWAATAQGKTQTGKK